MRIIVLIFFLAIGGITRGQSSDMVTWQDIEGKSICIEKGYNSNLLKHHLQRHERKFKRQYRHYHILLGKTTLKRLFDGIEMFYICQYHVTEIDSERVVLKSINKKPVDEIIFVYDKYYLGSFYNGCCRSIMRNPPKQDYWHKYNYGVTSGHYSASSVDKEFLYDFISKGFRVFTLDNFSSYEKPTANYWFSKDWYDLPIIFKAQEMRDKIFTYKNESIYKSQFFKDIDKN